MKKPSPILGAASAMIGEASERLVGRDSRFRHSFEAALERVRPDPDQPRKRFDEVEIQNLADTMAEQGQLQPILVRRDPEMRDSWIIVAGERRWRAARLNGWSAILAIEHEQDPELTALLENLQRIDLAPVEEARGLQRLIKDKGWSQNEAARALGKSKGEISASLRILTLPEEFLTSELDIPRNTLVELARIESAETRARLLELARAGNLTVRNVRVAREMEEQGEIDPGTPKGQKTSIQRAGPKLSGKALDRMVSTLSSLRAGGHRLKATERSRLIELKAEIEALLAG